MNNSRSPRGKPARRHISAKAAPSPSPAPEIQELLRSLEAEVLHLRSLFQDTLHYYGASVQAEIAQLAEPIKEAAKESRLEITPDQKRILQQMITLIRKVRVRPEKGRRKDLKAMEELAAELAALAEQWLWTK